VRSIYIIFLMSILKVARMGHPVLRAKARPLSATEIRSPRIQQLIDDMFETMREYQGIGLAAPQVHASVRLFVAGLEAKKDLSRASPSESRDRNIDEEDDDDQDRQSVPLMALINPEITPVGRESVEDWEGCLSIPDIRGRVPRAREIVVRAYDRTGKRTEMRVSGFTARVIQHETDHLDGILFFDRMISFESLTFLEEFGRFWSHREVVEE
jgi:peptide deformylase